MQYLYFATELFLNSFTKMSLIWVTLCDPINQTCDYIETVNSNNYTPVSELRPAIGPKKYGGL